MKTKQSIKFLLSFESTFRSDLVSWQIFEIVIKSNPVLAKHIRNNCALVVKTLSFKHNDITLKTSTPTFYNWLRNKYLSSLLYISHYDKHSVMCFCNFVVKKLKYNLTEIGGIGTLYCRLSTTWAFCRVLFVCINHWWYTGFHSVLQGRSTVTAPEFYNNVYRTRTLRHLLQWTNWWSYLPWRIWNSTCLHWTVRSYCTR